MIDLTLFIDSETSGLRKPGIAMDDPSQPHIVQLAGKLVTADRRCVSRFSALIRPEEWAIEPQAFAVHGISEKLAADAGIPEWAALVELKHRAMLATRIVGHNIFNFDSPIITSAILRAGGDALWWRSMAKKMQDTMEMSAPLLNLDGPIPGEPKWPTLEEAVEWFAGFAEPSSPEARWIGWKSIHRADDDLDATEFVFWSLMEMRHGKQDSTPGDSVRPFRRGS